MKKITLVFIVALVNVTSVKAMNNALTENDLLANLSLASKNQLGLIEQNHMLHEEIIRLSSSSSIDQQQIVFLNTRLNATYASIALSAEYIQTTVKELFTNANSLGLAKIKEQIKQLTEEYERAKKEGSINFIRLFSSPDSMSEKPELIMTGAYYTRRIEYLTRLQKHLESQ